MDSKAPTQIKERLDVADRPTAINSIKFSPSGLSLGCALANTSAQVFKLPLNGKGLSFLGELINLEFCICILSGHMSTIDA